MSPFVFCVVFIILHLQTKPILSHVVWTDRLIIHGGKCLPQIGAIVES